MRVEVGTQLKFRGAHWLVDRIGHYEETSLADIDSDILETRIRREGNTRYETKHIDTFVAGDIITTTTERISLSLPGADGFYIYTQFTVKKERSLGKDKDDAGSNTEGSKGADQLSSSEQIEGPRDGVQDGESIREEGAGSASGALHGGGSNGEGGVAGNPQVSEGSEHSAPHDGDSTGAWPGAD